MPAGGNPLAPNHNRNHMVQLERQDSCTTTYGPPDDSCPIRAPLEVSRPVLQAWVKESDAPTRDRIACGSLNSFEAITHPTREPKVLLFVRTTARFRDDMVDFQQAKDILLSTLAISTPVPRLSTHTGADGA